MDIIPEQVFPALSRATTRRAYVREPEARGVLPRLLCHRRKVEAVEPKRSRRACQFGKAPFDSSVEVIREPAGLLYRPGLLRVNLWCDANIGKIGDEEVRGAARDQVDQESLEGGERIRLTQGCKNIIAAAPDDVERAARRPRQLQEATYLRSQALWPCLDSRAPDCKIPAAAFTWSESQLEDLSELLHPNRPV
jgi:hypothetical protein